MSQAIWAVVPMKDTTHSKHRLSAALSPALRQRLAIAMFIDVLTTLRASPGLAGILVVTTDAEITAIATRNGARTTTLDATGGHTAAVTAGARLLASERHAGMLALPGDIPLVTPADIAAVLQSQATPSLTIVPAHDERGSNAVLLSPPHAMPLQFGNDSFAPHTALAASLQIPTTILRLPNIALDIDEPRDLDRFLQARSHTNAQALMDSATAAPYRSAIAAQGHRA